MNFFKVGEQVVIGKKQGKIVKRLKGNKYRVQFNFQIGTRNWDFKETNLRKL